MLWFKGISASFVICHSMKLEIKPNITLYGITLTGTYSVLSEHFDEVSENIYCHLNANIYFYGTISDYSSKATTALTGGKAIRLEAY